MKGLYNKLKNLFIINLVLLSSKINISYELSDLQQIRTAFQEIAYSYYIRGKNIQYDIYKKGLFNPEEATEQNINYLVCSGFTRNIYRQLLNITIPDFELLKYSRENIGKPEVVLYSNITSDKKMEMKIYSEKEINKYKTIINPSLKDVIPLVQIGDVLTYTGHTFLIYDIVTDVNGNVTDAIIIESTPSGSEFANIKVSPTLPNGKTLGSAVYLLLQNAKNKILKNIQEGTVRFGKLSEYKNWININNTKLRKEEYSILRFVHQDSEGNAVLKYTAVDLKQ